jgi:hypothetical protein
VLRFGKGVAQMPSSLSEEDEAHFEGEEDWEGASSESSEDADADPDISRCM